MITLITGDRVVLDGEGKVTRLVRAEGREHIPVRVLPSGTGEGIHVLPLDVVPLIEQGTLDRRLFNVTELGREEYARTGGLPLIVTWTDGSQETRRELQREAGPEIRAELESIDAQALLLEEAETSDAWEVLTGGVADTGLAPGVATIALDGYVEAMLDSSTGQVGAPAAWEAGYDGTGVTIAVLDTGIDADHGDFEGRVTGQANFSDAPTDEDRFGHGTHVASIAAGSGDRSDGTYRGVAPGATLLDGKVLNDEGGGFESHVVEGMQWAVDEGADIINMSLGWWEEPGIVNPLEEAVERLSAESGALFVVAAGNEGPDPASLRTPAVADSALTVGAAERNGDVADFSSRGPRLRDGAPKPDMLGPGVDIAAAAATGSLMEQFAEPVADGYVASSGTSMAAPHVAGAAAILAQQHPDRTGEQLKAALMGSASGLPDSPVLDQGTGLLDLERAIGQQVIAEPASLFFGTVEYPHEEAEPEVRTLTYRNLGDSDLTLDLSAEGLDPDGKPAPAAMFTLDTPQVTVPAGSTATVQVTADTSPGGDVHGAYSLFLTAQGDGQELRTAGVVHREPEMFELTVNATGRDGEPAGWWEGTVTDVTTGRFLPLAAHEPSATIRLPEGDYVVEGVVHHGDRTGTTPTGSDWLVAPHVGVTGDASLDLSAAEAEELTLSMPDKRLEAPELTMAYDLFTEEAPVWGLTFFGALPEGVRTAQVGDVPGEWDMTSAVTAFWEIPDGSKQYADFHVKEDGFHTGLDQHTRKKDLAKIRARVGSSAEGKEGLLGTAPAYLPISGGGITQLPFTTEIHVRAAGTQWTQDFLQLSGDTVEVFSQGAPEKFAAGRSHLRTFNTGVMGPTMGRDGEGGGVFRYDDEIFVHIPPFADGTHRYVDSLYDSAMTRLYRNGELWEERPAPSDWVGFAVPADEAEYRLVADIDRTASGVASVTTRVLLDYTFTSSNPGEDEFVQLDASAVRFTPELAPDSTSPAGRRLTVPVTVEGPASGGDLGSLVVEVSTDRGETWRKAKVSKGALRVTNPPAGSTVSLRATVTDRQGNTGVQTLIDAYRSR